MCLGTKLWLTGFVTWVTSVLTANNKKKMFWGAKLLRVHLNASQGFLAPYIDYHGTLTDAGEFLVLDPQGKISTGAANGITGPGLTCMRCYGADYRR